MLRSTSPSRNPSFWALATIFATVLLAVPAFAEAPAEQGASSAEQAQSRRDAEEKNAEAVASRRLRRAQGNAFWWLYISGLGLAALIPLGYYFYRRFQPEQGYDVDPEEIGFEGPPFEEPSAERSSASQGAMSKAEKAFFSVPESSSGDAAAQVTMGQSGSAERMCPECGEQFPASVVLCPYDSTPLENIDDRRSGSSSQDTVLERQRCPGCGRRYAPGPEYCYHDGMHLRQDTVEDAEEAPEFKACETCGWEGQTDDRICPNDGAELTTVAPDEDGRATPPLPVLVCPECDTFAEPGLARCPEDGTVLTPLRNRHAPQLPARGFGPRRKICQECGETFSQAATYCTHDGAELVPMN